ncbi:MAG TPA: thioredoxin domain-containing protein [Gaiellaceae bacterium]|nr:thioredoxin domain-containing protein [Gaiellaceae bacterium]
MRDLDAGTFDTAVAGAPVLVDFWAPWCKPCKAIEPILEELEGSVSVARVDIDAEPDLAARYDVLAIPTVMLFVDGEPRGTVHGARPKGHYERWLAEMLPAGELDGVAVQSHLDA